MVWYCRGDELSECELNIEDCPQLTNSIPSYDMIEFVMSIHEEYLPAGTCPD